MTWLLAAFIMNSFPARTHFRTTALEKGSAQAYRGHSSSAGYDPPVTEHGIELTPFLLAFASALLAGVLLGPSVLGLVPLTEGIHLVAEIGIILLLFEAGLHTDLQEPIRVA